PESIGPGELREDYPAAFEECNRAFPALIAGERAEAFAVRKRALHHIGEVRRVASAADILRLARGREGAQPDSRDAAMTERGALLRESHASLRDLYEVSTKEIEELIAIIDGSGLAYGARMMGGGFGGNVLALAPETAFASLIDLVQETFYSPRNRNGSQEGSIMVSTPGFGLSEIEL